MHTHSTVVNAFTCCVKGQELLRSKLGDAIPSTSAMLTPGSRWPPLCAMHWAITAKRPAAIARARWSCRTTAWSLRRYARAGEGGHRLDSLAAQARAPGSCESARVWCLAEKRAGQQTIIEIIAPALRGLLGSADRLRVVSFDGQRR